jgi:hypothetical protein
MLVSFMLLLILCILYFCNVFKWSPFFMWSYNVHCICYGPVFNMLLEYPELLLLSLTACVCSLWNVLPVCPTYFIGRSRHFISRMPLLLYLSVRERCFTMFCIVFCVLNAIFICVFLNNFFYISCIFPAVCESDLFCFSVLWIDVCIFVGWVVSWLCNINNYRYVVV